MGDNELDLYADVVDTFPQGDETASSMLIGETVEDRRSNLVGVDMLDEVIAATSSRPANSHGANPQIHQQEMMMISNQSQSNAGGNFGGANFANASVPAPAGPSTVGKRVSLYIQNLTWWTTDEDLRNALHSLEVDDLVEIKFLENRVNGQSRGIALVTVGSENSGRIVMERLPRSSIHGQTPEVSHANRQNIHQLEMQAGGMQGRKDNFGNNGVGGGRNSNNMMGSARLPNPGLPLGGNANAVPLNNPAAAAIFLNHLAQQASLFQRPVQQQRPNNNVLAAMAQLTARFRTNQPRAPNPIQWQGMERPERFSSRMMGNAQMMTDPRQLDHHMDSVEVQQLLERNKMISSNALAASVQSASDGDYASAIETLVTAISLIKQSKIADDDRSQILVSSLQDTLRSIEEKSYLSAPRKRSSSRDRFSSRFSHESIDCRSRRFSPSESRKEHFGQSDRRHSRSPLPSDDRHRRGVRSPAGRRCRRSSSSSSGSFRRSRHANRRTSKNRPYNEYPPHSEGRR